MTHQPNYEDDSVPHVPDWRTVALADIHPNPVQGAVYFDVWCSECGQSGSFMLNITEDNDRVAWV